MLVGTREHHITPLSNFITRPSSIAQFADYAKGPDAITPLVTLLRVDPITSTLSTLVPGAERHPDACVMYVSGSWDLFTPTHMDFLRQVHAAHPQAYVVVGIEDDKVCIPPTSYALLVTDAARPQMRTRGSTTPS